MCCCLTPILGAQPKSSLDLPATIHYALQHSPQLDKNQRGVTVSQLEKFNAFAEFLPQIDLALEHRVNNRTPNDGVSGLTLSMMHNIFDHGTKFNQLKSKQLQQLRSGLNLANQRNAIIQQVANAYLNLSLQTQKLRIQQKTHQQVKLQYQLAEEEFQQGLKTESDLLRFASQLYRADSNLNVQKTAVEVARVDLLNAMGVPIGAEDYAQLTFALENLADFDVKSLPRIAPSLSDHYIYQIAKVDERINQLAVDKAKLEFWPRVDIKSTAFYRIDNNANASVPLVNENVSLINREDFDANLILQFKTQVFDWGIRERNVKIAKQNQYIQQDDINAELISLKAQISKLIERIQQLAKRYQVDKTLLNAERRNYEMLEQDYREGRVFFLDLITGITNLSQAEISWVNTIYELNIAMYEYNYHLGNLYEKFTQ
jgi:outer membrane protein TolC